MNNPLRILQTLDRHLAAPAEITLFGRAAVALGYATSPAAFAATHDVDDREIGDRRGEGTALWNSALEWDKLGDRAQAIAHAEAALSLCEAIEDPYAATVRARLAQWRAAKP